MVGGGRFIAAVSAVRYVASSAPEAEIRRMLAGHRLAGVFQGVSGHRWTSVRTALGLTVPDLAERAGMSGNEVGASRRGHRVSAMTFWCGTAWYGEVP